MFVSLDSFIKFWKHSHVVLFQTVFVIHVLLIEEIHTLLGGSVG